MMIVKNMSLFHHKYIQKIEIIKNIYRVDLILRQDIVKTICMILNLISLNRLDYKWKSFVLILFL